MFISELTHNRYLQTFKFHQNVLYNTRTRVHDEHDINIGMKMFNELRTYHNTMSNTELLLFLYFLLPRQIKCLYNNVL